MAFKPRAALSVLLLAMTCTLPALAEPSDSLKEVARNLMAEGRELREKSDHNGALSRFQAADAIMGVPTTGFEIARSQADLRLLVEARSTLRRVLTLPQRDDEPEPFRAARARAQALDTELEQRIGGLRLLLRVTSSAAASVTVDENEISPPALEAPLRLNPGRHRVVLRAYGREQTRVVDVPEREIVSLELGLTQEPATTPTASATDSAATAEPSAAPPADVAPRRAVPTLAYVGGGVAAAGLVVGGVSGLFAISRKSRAEAGCEGTRCPPATWDDLDAAQSFASVSTVGFVVAGVGLGIGVGALLFGRGSGTTAASLQLRARPDSLRLSGRF